MSTSSFFRDLEAMVIEYGWWIVLRSFNLSKHSKYWDDISKEAIGGPPYLHNDIIFKGRRTETVGSDSERIESRQQFTELYNTTFYILGNIRPKKEDLIIEITPESKQLATPPKMVRPYELFNIEHVEPKIEKGVIISKCYCSRFTPVNDETLQGMIPVKYKRLYRT